MWTGKRKPTEQVHEAQGFVYIGLLIGLAIVGIGLSATSVVWTQTRQREKEEELLFVGNQIRHAITQFYIRSPAAGRRFPMGLEELVDDTRAPDKPLHHLRRIYADPITGTASWGEVRLPSGQLVGVYSSSTDAPFKVAGFALRDKDFQDKERYADWVFRSALPAANPVLAPGASYSTPAATPGAPPRPPPPSPLPGRAPRQPVPGNLGLPGIGLR